MFTLLLAAGKSRASDATLASRWAASWITDLAYAICPAVAARLTMTKMAGAMIRASSVTLPCSRPRENRGPLMGSPDW